MRWESWEPEEPARGCRMTDSGNWRSRLVDSEAGITTILDRIRTVAVLGMKTPDGNPPAHFVPAHAKKVGLRIFPVPVFYPDLTEMLGEKVYRRVADIPEQVDLVDVFRKPSDIPAHLDDIIAAKPHAAWFQLGIRNEEAAERLAKEGILVVQDRCLLVELQDRGR
jgi:predicted CoA-binding protein